MTTVTSANTLDETLPLGAAFCKKMREKLSKRLLSALYRCSVAEFEQTNIFL